MEAILIFYTLQGPKFNLEIHEDNIKLVKKKWFRIWNRTPTVTSWEIKNLSQFEVTVPRFFIFSGKIEWKTFEGQQGQFRFTTTPAMVKKIETYLQKRVIKNHQQFKQIRPETRAKRSVA